MFDVDRKAADPRPLYQQIKESILAKIRSGEWSVGSRIPSENQLVAEMGISRMTINRALRELTQEGVLARLQGVGTFVREPARQASLLELKNIADEIRERGHRHSAKVIEKKACQATPEIASRFEHEMGGDSACDCNREVFHVVLVHREDSVPMQIEDRYVNPEVAPEFLDQDFTRVTPTEYLLQIAPVSHLEHVVRAVMPDPAQQEILDVGAGEPCLVLDRRSWSWGRIASVVRLTYPASRYELRGRYRTSQSGTLSESGGLQPEDRLSRETLSREKPSLKKPSQEKPSQEKPFKENPS